MNLTRTAYGTWSGGRFMHFGENLDEDRFIKTFQIAYEAGIRTFITADVYGGGRADEMLGKALKGIDRDSYCLVGAIGHDFVMGQRQGSVGYPRFTDPKLRGPQDYAEYVIEATEGSLKRCDTDHFDLLLLHNPDNRGYSDETVWNAMSGAKKAGITSQLGIAPGPANGFTLDLVDCFEKFGETIDWAMIILNPVEPWPGRLPLAAAKKYDIDILTRVVDHGGIFHDDVNPGHHFREGDHRTYRPDGWVEDGCTKREKMRPIADKHGMSMLHFACQYDLCQEPVKCVAPTFIQEAGENAVPIEDKIRDFAALPEENLLSAEEIEEISKIGDNTGCMALKGASQRHEEQLRPDEWPMREELLAIGDKYGLGRKW